MDDQMKGSIVLLSDLCSNPDLAGFLNALVAFFFGGGGHLPPLKRACVVYQWDFRRG